MADSGSGVFRRAFSWLPSSFASQSNAPVGAPRQFGSTEHLSIEAVAAFVDGELRMNAHLRAGHHLSLCPQCAAEVDAQRQARAALRESHPVRVPANLLGMLSRIPLHPEHLHPDHVDGDAAGEPGKRPGKRPAADPDARSPKQLADDVTRGRRKRR